MENVKIIREASVQRFNFTDYFKGFEKCHAVREIFGDRTEEVLRNLKVEFFSGRRGYMGVSDEDGHLMVSTNHLKNSDERTLYLDVVHELVHVRQFSEEKDLFDSNYEYVDRPTEIEAYRHGAKEARRLGMKDEEIYEYLRTDWMTEEELNRLARAVGVKTFPSSLRQKNKPNRFGK